MNPKTHISIDPSDDSIQSVIPEVVPLMPVRGVVVFPGTFAQLGVERSMNRRMLETTLPGEKQIVLVLENQDVGEGPARPDQLHKVGVLVEVIKLFRPTEHQLGVTVRALKRVKILEATQEEPFLRARIEALETSVPDADDDYWQAAFRNLQESAQRFIELSPTIPAEAKAAVLEYNTPEELTDFLAGNLGMDITLKQDILAQRDAVLRLELIQTYLNNQLHIAELQEKLRGDMESQFSDHQRRAYLREQLRAIQNELGEGDGTEEQVDELREQLEAAGLPDAVWTIAEKELKRLDAMPAASPEHGVITNYLTSLAELPWNKLSDDDLDLIKAREVLDADHHGLDKVKQRMIEYLAVRKLNPEGRGPILCLLGPPGVGKTSLGKSVAASLGREFARISLGGIRDESEIRGHRRTYIGAMPGRLIQELRRLGTRNPVIMLDEIDKLGFDFRGDPASALLELLDPNQNDSFTDRYLDVPFDMSQVLFIATANDISPVPAPLRDRMEIIQIPGYTTEEKQAIGTDYLIPRQQKENGLRPEQCVWEPAALNKVIDAHTREAGVRNLERKIGSVCRRVAAEVAQEKHDGRSVTPDVVTEVLGAVEYDHTLQVEESAPGVVSGLAWTPVGGDVLHIEAIRFPGSGKIKLTGQLGDVMKESVQIAHSLLRSRAASLGIDIADLDGSDVHVHVPAGAVPKDGPSAGVTMFTALASMFTDRPVRRDVAMTGELTLRGLVLPIGGLKEKTIAALRAGIKTVLIPAKNAREIPELPQSTQDALEIIPVKTVDDALEVALLPRA